VAKRKLTPEILETIELCAADEYTLDEIRDEANIIKPLMSDPKVLEAIEKGRIKWFVEIVATNGDIDSYIFYTGKSFDEVGEMFDTYKETIELRKTEVEQAEKKKIKAEKHSTRQFSCPMHIGMVNILEQNGKSDAPISHQVLHDDIEKMIKEMQDGDTTALLTMLTTNIMQLQLFNGTVTRNLMGKAGKELDNFNKLSNMQLKVMQETRKSIIAINEITNPKRPTFIKEANQYNHLHQNSEKKDEKQNELQKPEQLEEPHNTIEAEVILAREEVK